MEEGQARKRKADAITRRGASAIEIAKKRSKSENHDKILANSQVSCPLCGGFSKKRFALGRGIAAHLEAVHTPWKPSKIAQKIHKRQYERRARDIDRNMVKSSPEPAAFEPLKAYTPTEEQVDDWERKLLSICLGLEQGLYQSNTSSQPSVAYASSLVPFLAAARDGDLAGLRRLYEEDPSLLSSVDRHGSSAEHWAAGQGHLECLQYLLNLRINQQQSSSDKIKTLSKRIRRRDGKTCLHYAARNGQLHIAKYLIEVMEYKVDERSGEGSTPLHLACYGGHPEMIEYLHGTAGADIHAVNDWKCSAAHWIGMTIQTYRDKVWGCCEYLLHHGVSFTMVQSQGHTAAHKAAQKKNQLVLEWMMKSIPKDRLKRIGGDKGGHRPRDIWIAVGGDEDFAQVLLEYQL